MGTIVDTSKMELFERLDGECRLSTLQNIVKFQALWRGYRVRKLMSTVYAEYTAMALEIEEDSELTYPWIKPNILSIFCPKTTSTRSSVHKSTALSECVQKSQHTQSGTQTMCGTEDTSVSCDNSSATCDSESDKKPDQTESQVHSANGKNEDRGETSQVKHEHKSDTTSDTTNSKCSKQESENNTESAVENSTSTHGDANSQVPTSAENAEISACPESSTDNQETGDNQSIINIKDNTSVWDTLECSVSLPGDKKLEGLSEEALIEERNEALLELYWVQQAIHSRKQYLNYRAQITDPSR